MTCPNCGAKLQNKLSCPYCGYENTEQAQAQHKKEIAAIYERIARMLHFPEQWASQVSRWLLRSAKWLVIVFLFCAIIAGIYSMIAPNTAMNRQKQALQDLEECYIAGDYDSMQALLDKNSNSYKAIYDKYTTVGNLHGVLADLETRIPTIVDDFAQGQPYALLSSIELARIFSVLQQCDELEEKGYVYGESDAVAQFRQRAFALLETLQFTEEMIQEGMDLAITEDPDYTQLREQVERLLSGGIQ